MKQTRNVNHCRILVSGDNSVGSLTNQNATTYTPYSLRGVWRKEKKSLKISRRIRYGKMEEMRIQQRRSPYRWLFHRGFRKVKGGKMAMEERGTCPWTKNKNKRQRWEGREDDRGSFEPPHGFHILLLMYFTRASSSMTFNSGVLSAPYKRIHKNQLNETNKWWW